MSSHDEAEARASALVEALGFPDDPEMADTPRRLVSWLSAFRGAEGLPAVSVCASEGRAPVVMRGIPFHSVCAHHLLPFFGTVSIAYRPDGRIAGLGSLSRAVAHFAQRPQVQERLGEQVAAFLGEALAPAGLVVRIRARQLCVELTQGVQPDVLTEAVHGVADEGLYRLLEAR